MTESEKLPVHACILDCTRDLRYFRSTGINRRHPPSSGEGNESTISGRNYYLEGALYYLSATLSYRCLYLGFVQCNIVNLHFRDFPFKISTIVNSNPHSNFVSVGCDRITYAFVT